MDDRSRQNRYVLSAFVGCAALTTFIFAMGKLGFGLPKKDPVQIIPDAPNSLSNTAGIELSGFNQAQLNSYLTGRNFKIAPDMPLHEMRRCYLAYHYQALFDSVHVRTAIPVSVLFAYFIVEATREGIESPLFSDTWNPGGVKYRGRFSPYYSFDDCFQNWAPVKCAFERPGSFENAVGLWAEVFNQERYRACKGVAVLPTCKCLEKAGYHGAKNHRQRARIAESYHKYQKMFPDARR